MESANSSQENKRYNAEVNLLDGLYEFHPEFFGHLAKEDQEVMERYYCLGRPTPDNIFEYRARLVLHAQDIESQAHAAFTKLCQLANIKDFRYSD